MIATYYATQPTKANIIQTSNTLQTISQNVFILLTLIASFAFIEPSFFGKLYALSIVFTIAAIFNLLMCHLVSFV